MKNGDKLYGWGVTDVSDVPEVGGVIYIMEHEKSGARLCYLDREDACKTFAIIFGTVPTDDTGVFHILEHSVLCGSKKFPLKEPFTDLLKSSLNTFLNALTYNDKTAYPVSSRNDKDFYNLVDVYMDAVLNPNAVKCENIFRQEGWRYEVQEDGALDYNGVVYSEMRGAYSSPEELADATIAKLLYPGGTYSYDSGGDPTAITSLEYRDFCRAHEKFYRPDNSYIFLDGKPKLHEILPLLDSYLSNYERGDFSLDITLGDDVNTEPLEVEYEIEEGEDEANKTRLYLAYRTGECTDQIRASALSVLADAIADSNEAPFKKAILSSGLCDNVYFSTNTGLKWNSLVVEFRGVKDGREEELLEHYRSTVCNMVKEGIDRALIRASIDLSEFRAREADYGSYPKGIIYMSAVTDGWFYGIHPREMLSYEVTYTRLRELANGDYYTQLLSEVTSSACATLTLRPSKTLAQKRSEEQKEELAAILDRMSENDRAMLREFSREFEVWQSRTDTEEALASLPTLTRDDLDPTPHETPTLVSKCEGTQVIAHPIETGGITYTEMYFDASDTPPEDIPILALMWLVYSNLDTHLGSANDFRRRAKSELGNIVMSNHACKNGDDARFYMLLQFSSLDSKQRSALELAEEYLFGITLDNPEAIRRKITQILAAFSDRMTGSGHSAAIMRTAARYSSYEAIKEYAIGYEFYRGIKKYKNASDSELSALIAKMKELHERIFVKKRLTVAITGKENPEYAKACVSMVKKDGTPSAPSSVQPLPRRSEGFAVPSQVSYATMGTNLTGHGVRTGAWSTLTTILNFVILWDEVRVKGGAYGTGFLSRQNSGTVGMYSFRDPSPARTLSVYRTVVDRLRDFLADEPDLTRYVIGTVGTLDEVTSPAGDGASATALYLAGKSHNDVARDRQEAIGASCSDLLSAAELLERALVDATVTVVGAREALKELELDEILEL